MHSICIFWNSPIWKSHLNSHNSLYGWCNKFTHLWLGDMQHLGIPTIHSDISRPGLCHIGLHSEADMWFPPVGNWVLDSHTLLPPYRKNIHLGLSDMQHLRNPAIHSAINCLGLGHSPRSKFASSHVDNRSLESHNPWYGHTINYSPGI